MAREIIVTSVFKSPADGSTSVSGVFWLVAPAALVQPKANAISIVPSSTIVSWGITSAELTAIQNGTIVEQTFSSGQIPSGTTLNAFQTGLQNAYATAQTALNNTAPTSHWIGASWDGNVWTAAP